LLGIALSHPGSFPVGKVDFLTLLPMNFYEFLMAHNEDMLCDYLHKLHPNKMVSDLFLQKLEGYLRSYYITGGMPEVVSKWIDTKDVMVVEQVQQAILDSYELDFAKHAPVKDYPKLSLVWHSIPEQLARENSKFVFGHVKRGMRARDLEDALGWLINAGLVYKVTKIETPLIPLSAYADQTHFKLYMADVGLLRRMARLPSEALLAGGDTYRQFKGALTENYVLCELVSLQEDVPFYWKSGNTAEVDFVVQFGMDIVPLEVKSEYNTRARSMAEYRKKYTPRVSVKTSLNNVSGEEVRNIPLYLLWKLKDYIK
ncbi:MAG: DUF4143 domain-containing protein, partial [bacterium]|nr:DUF4143 domain-containing protein [bacterium]